MKITCETKDALPLSALTEFQGGLKTRTADDTKKIEKSIHDYGFATPFFVWKHDGKNKVLDGHGRLEALKQMQKRGEEIPDLPVVFIDCKDEAAAKNLLLRICSTYGEMTAESVFDFIGGIDINLEDLKLPAGLIDLSAALPNDETQGDDDAPAVSEESEPDSQRGEVYELGNSILMCGDSTSEEDVARLMGGDKADLVFTDPPYNVAIGDKNKALQSFQKAGMITENIENDFFKTDEECAEKLWLPCFKNLFENAKDECAIYVTMPQGGTHMMMMMMMMRDSGWQVKHELIWVKNSPTFSMGRLNYDYQHEPILYGWKKSHKWVGKGKFNKSIWEIDKPRKCDLHPTMKPIELVENALLNSSDRNDIVLDLFGGSGTTIIAAERCGRKARVMELDPHYCDVIRKRWTKWAKENGREVGSGGLD